MLNEKKTSEEKSFLKGSLALAVSVIVVKILGFVYKLPLSYLLGDEGMGYFNSAYTVFSFFYMISCAGIPKALSIMIGECRDENGSCERKILYTALRIFAIVGGICTALIIILSKPLAAFIGNVDASFSLVTIAPTLFFVTVSGVLRGYLNGKEKFLPIALSGVVEGVVKFVFGLAFAIAAKRACMSLSSVSAMTVLGVSLGSLFALLIMYISSKNQISKYNMGQKLRCDVTESAIIKRLLMISVPVAIGAALNGLSGVIDLFLIMKRLIFLGYTPTDAIALYGNYTTLAIPMSGLILALISPVAVAALPTISRASGEGKKALGEAFTRVCEPVAFFALPLCMALSFFSREILTVLFDDASALTAAPLLSILAPSVVFTFLLTMNNVLLEGTMNTKAPLIALGIGALVKAVASYFLIGYRDLGVLGAPLGTLISAFAALVISFITVRVRVGVSLRVIPVSARILLICLLSLSVARYIYDSFIEVRFGEIGAFVALIIGGAIYLLISCGVFLLGKRRQNIQKNKDYVM